MQKETPTTQNRAKLAAMRHLLDFFNEKQGTEFTSKWVW
jgi:hypothetical protein